MYMTVGYDADYFDGQASIERYAPFSLLAPLTRRNSWARQRVLASIKAKERRFAANRAKSIVNQLRPKKALDIGTASGELIYELLKLGVDSYGVEVSESIINSQKDIVLKKRIKKAEANKLPFNSDTFDVVCAYHVLEHIYYEELKESIKEMARVSSHYLVLEFPTSHNPWAKTDDTHVSVHDDSWWINLFHDLLPNWRTSKMRKSNFLTSMQIILEKSET